MNSHSLAGGLLAVLAFAGVSMAQTTLPGGVTTSPLAPPTIPVIQQTFTSGMVGFTTNQTARLNVLNLNAVPTSTTTTTAPANCTVALQFFDSKNNQLSQTVVPNFAPQAATSFDLTRASVTSASVGRTEIRGVVVVNPTSATSSTSTEGYCSVMTTLEIFDATTGSTVSSTSDTRSIGGFAVLTAVGSSAIGR